MNIRRGAPYVATVLGQLALTVVLEALRDLATSTAVLLAYLTVVLFSAAAWGTWPALVAAERGSPWALQELAEVDGWLAELRPRCAA